MNPNFTREQARPEYETPRDDIREPRLSKMDRAVIGGVIGLCVFALLFFALGWAVGRNQLLEGTFVRHTDSAVPWNDRSVTPAPETR